MNPHDPPSEASEGPDRTKAPFAKPTLEFPVLSVDLFRGALQTITHEIQAGGQELETGGILLGHTHGDDVVVTAAGGPGPGAVRRPDYFLRDRHHAQQLAETAWASDASQWIGDWHTHPHGPSHPSPLDLRSTAQVLSDPALGFTTFLTLIAVPRLTQPAQGDVSTRGRKPATADWSLLGWKVQGNPEALTLMEVSLRIRFAGSTSVFGGS